MSHKKTYQCQQIDPATQDCTLWQEIPQTPLPISKADANALTVAIIGFMVFVFITQQIIKAVK